jgi:hypothetical protein
MAFDLSALIRLYLRPIKLLIFLRLEFSPIDVYWSFVDKQEMLYHLYPGKKQINRTNNLISLRSSGPNEFPEAF